MRGGRLGHGAGYYDKLLGALTGARPWSQGPSRSSWWMSFPLVDELNADASIDGILVQMPLPAHIDDETVIERIA